MTTLVAILAGLAVAAFAILWLTAVGQILVGELSDRLSRLRR